MLHPASLNFKSLANSTPSGTVLLGNKKMLKQLQGNASVPIYDNSSSNSNILVTNEVLHEGTYSISGGDGHAIPSGWMVASSCTFSIAPQHDMVCKMHIKILSNQTTT